jgi:hypothetical protein
VTTLEAAFRAGLEAAARHHDDEAVRCGEQLAHGDGDPYGVGLLAREHEDDAAMIRAIPAPPEYAAPERKWVRAEDWRGEPNAHQDIWRWSGTKMLLLAHIVLGVDGKVFWPTGVHPNDLLSPILPGELPEPPKDEG